MVDHEPPPGGGRKQDSDRNERKTWASVLGRNMVSKNDDNVLEVMLEKDTKGAFKVTEEDCANLMKRLGLDQRPGVHVLGVQICPQGRGVIYITLKKEVDITRFCKHDVLDVTRAGIRSVLVRPAGKREVVVTAKGIHPSTRDDYVFEYLKKFGKVSSTKVIYGVFPEGPLKGMRNGDRSYKVEINPKINLGSYHIIDGQKISIRYPGQQQTCARCHKTPVDCKGKGMARQCEAEGGEKVEFLDYILNLWSAIGYSPENIENINLDVVNGSDTLQQVGGTFTPVKYDQSNSEKFTGVSVKSFPKDMDHGDIMDFLVKSGLPDSKTDNVTINNRGTATVRDLENSECLVLIENIHEKRFFEKKMFCNGIVPLSPEKPGSQSVVHHPAKDTAVQDQSCNSSQEKGFTPQASSAALTSLPNMVASSPTTAGLITPPTTCPPSIALTAPHSELTTANSSSASSSIDSSESFHQTFTSDMFEKNEDLVRRHSISIIDRTPPPNSLACEILESRKVSQALRTSILSNIADIQESLSDFNSCAESLGESCDSTDDGELDLKKDDNHEFKSSNEKKRAKKLKRKLSLTPGKEQFLKKKNTKED